MTTDELMALAANCEDAAHELRHAEHSGASADVIAALRSELRADRDKLRAALAAAPHTATPVVQDARAEEDVTEIAFEAWWLRHGQFCRAGGGDYEKTFAYRAWLAALETPCAATPVVQPVVPPTKEMLDAFQRGFQQQLQIRHKARFKQPEDWTARERMSAEEAGLRAMLSAAPASDADSMQGSQPTKEN